MGKILRGHFKANQTINTKPWYKNSLIEIIEIDDLKEPIVCEPVFLEDTLPKNLVLYYQPPKTIKRS